MPRKNWISGFVIVHIEKCGRCYKLTLKGYCRRAAATVAVELFDRNQEAVVGENGQPFAIVEMRPSGLRSAKVPIGREYQQPRKLFKREVFHRFVCVIEIPVSVLKKSSDVVVNVAPTCGLDTTASCCTPLYSRSDCMHLVFNRRRLAKPTEGYGVPFLLITRQDASVRMDGIVKKYPVLCRHDKVTMLALSNMMLRMFRGNFSPLLTETL